MLKFTLEPPGPPPGLTKSDYNAACAVAFAEMGTLWHTRYLPKHFTHAGARKYHYVPRQGQGPMGGQRFRQSYTGRKERYYGHTLPLVYTGTSRTRALIQKIRANSRGVRVVIDAPALNFIPKGGRISLRDEVTRIADDEWQAMERAFEARLNDEVQRRIDNAEVARGIKKEMRRRK